MAGLLWLCADHPAIITCMDVVAHSPCCYIYVLVLTPTNQPTYDPPPGAPLQLLVTYEGKHNHPPPPGGGSANRLARRIMSTPDAGQYKAGEW